MSLRAAGRVGPGLPDAGTQLSLSWASSPVIWKVGYIRVFLDPQIPSRGHHVAPIYEGGRKSSSKEGPLPTSQRPGGARVRSRPDSDLCGYTLKVGASSGPVPPDDSAKAPCRPEQSFFTTSICL